MAETAGTLRAIVQRRVRDINATYHANAFVLDILSRTQRLINVGTQLVKASATLTLNANQQLYTINTDVSTSAVDVLKVTYQNQDLDKQTFTELNQIDRRWWRKVGSKPETWAQIGRTLLVVHPAVSQSSSVTVTYSKLTNDLVADATALEISEDTDLMVVDLTQAILEIRQRDFDQAIESIGRFTDRFQGEFGLLDLVDTELGE